MSSTFMNSLWCELTGTTRIEMKQLLATMQTWFMRLYSYIWMLLRYHVSALFSYSVRVPQSTSALVISSRPGYPTGVFSLLLFTTCASVQRTFIQNHRKPTRQAHLSSSNRAFSQTYLHRERHVKRSFIISLRQLTDPQEASVLNKAATTGICPGKAFQSPAAPHVMPS